MPRNAALVLTALAIAWSTTGTALELEDCRISAGPSFPSIKARCGDFDRPLNPDDPEAGTIALRVAVVPALNLEPHPDPVVPLAGGPGQGAIEFYSLYRGAFEPLRRDRDILLVDQRGTGESARMDCPVDASLIDGQYSFDATVEFMRECLDALPHDPRFFTTSIAVKDLEAVRAALGYPSLNVYGVSYGSRVAQHFARRYPAVTRTIVVDGVVPPQLSLGPAIAVEAQSAVDNIFARCAEDAKCNERFPNIASTFETLTRELGANPAMVKHADPVTGKYETTRFGREELATAVRLLAYSPDSIAMLPLVVAEAGSGNLAPLAAQFQMVAESLSTALALGMHNAILCTEDTPYYTPGMIDTKALEASFIGPMQLEAIRAICSVWPAGPIDDDFKEPLATDIPTLLLSGSADPITPPAYADMAAINLRKAWLRTGEDQGHGQINVGCMPRLVAEFVDAASLDEVDTSCMDESFVMPFFLDFSGPSP